MGMIEGSMRKTPDGQDPAAYLNKVIKNLSEEDFDYMESYEGKVLKPEEFEEAWSLQDNLKKEEAIKEKYRALTEKGRVVYVEVEW